MSEHRASVRWKRESADFAYDNYNRSHEWELSGVRVPASAAPEFLGSDTRVDPEQAFVAALSGCHMLTFLAVASRRRLVVDRYEDDAVGFLVKNPDGKLHMARVVLHPRVVFAPGAEPPPSDLEKLHHTAHENCFIANSVTTEVAVEPVEPEDGY